VILIFCVFVIAPCGEACSVTSVSCVTIGAVACWALRGRELDIFIYIYTRGDVAVVAGTRALVFGQITTMATGPGQCFGTNGAEDKSPGGDACMSVWGSETGVLGTL